MSCSENDSTNSGSSPSREVAFDEYGQFGYALEPEYTEEELHEMEAAESSRNQDILSNPRHFNTDLCSCTKCIVMPLLTECLCCHEFTLFDGISITDYRLMVNEEVDIIFHCVECVRIPQDMEVEAPEVLEAPPSPAPPSPAPASPHPAPPPASPQPLDDTLPDHSFDITLEVAEENPVVESDIEDPELSDSFVEDIPVTFEVVENGTMKRAKKLVSMFVLMSRKRKRDYKAVFERLKQVVPDLRVQAFCLDFESAAWSAIKTVFPTAEIKGCSFHWCQAVMRKVAMLGLKTAYDSKKSVHLFIRKLLALPYLPSDHIRPAFTEMLQTTATASPQIKQLMTYLQRTWFNNTVWTVQQWSVHRLSVRTNNDVEGWHRRFNGKAAHNHLHFYKIVPAFQQEAKTVSITQQLVSEQQLSRYQRDTYKQLQGRLTSLWDQYEEDSIRTSDFLRSVGHLYAPPVPQPETLPESDSEDSDYESD
ncbi:unnamed protein product [Mytilus edulis]|uniref:MULE transposase domain-containing protein n=1 Tax=Mytilus edulis TaxID=6550 RepID=A0A8S3UCQ7_MYTED|nr:unnamed protein product [Mytilus edulis]